MRNKFIKFYSVFGLPNPSNFLARKALAYSRSFKNHSSASPSNRITLKQITYPVTPTSAPKIFSGSVCQYKIVKIIKKSNRATSIRQNPRDKETTKLFVSNDLSDISMVLVIILLKGYRRLA